MEKVLLAHVPYDVFGGEDAHVSLLEKVYVELGIEPVRFPLSPEKDLLAAIRSLSFGDRRGWQRATKSVRFAHLHNIHPSLGPAFLRWLSRAQIPALMTVHNHRFYCTNGLALRSGEICKLCRGRYPWRSLVHNCNGSWTKSAYHAFALSEAKVENLFISAINRFLAPSPYVRDELINSGFPPDKIGLLLHPVDFTEVSSAVEFDIVYAGRLSEEKGIRPLLEAAKRLPTFRFAITGKGPMEKELRSFADQNSNLLFQPELSRQEVLSLIGRSKIGVAPSLCNETFSLFAMECFLQGKRVVVPTLESANWLSKSPFFGFAADIRSIDSLVNAIESCHAASPPPRSSVLELRETLSRERFKRELMEEVRALR